MEAVTQHPAAIEVRRLRWREAPRMALLAAQTIEREARGRERADGTRRPRLHRARALYPPPPVRFYVLFIATLLDLLAVPTWVGHSPTGVAVVTEWPLTGRGRRRHRCRLLAFAAAFDAVLLLVVTAALVVQPLILVPLAAPSIPVFWPVGALLVDGFRTRSLRRTQAELVARAAGSVHVAVGLVGSGPGAGHALLHALVARTDATNVTVLARTEAGPLVGASTAQPGSQSPPRRPPGGGLRYCLSANRRRRPGPLRREHDDTRHPTQDERGAPTARKEWPEVDPRYAAS